MKRALFPLLLALGLLAGGHLALAKGVVLQLTPEEATPGSTVFLEARALPGTTLQGLNFSVGIRAATSIGGDAPWFQDVQPTTGPLAMGGLPFGEVQSDGSYGMGLALVPPVTGEGLLIRLPITIPSGAKPGAAFQLIVPSATAVDAQYQPVPLSLISNALIITDPNQKTDALLDAGNAAGLPGTTLSLPLRLGDVGGVGAVDVTLRLTGLPTGQMAVFGPVASTALTWNSLLSSQQQPNGDVRIALADTKGLKGPGDLLQLPVTLPAGLPPGIYPVQIVSAQLSRIDGQPLPTTFDGGQVIVLKGQPGVPMGLEFYSPHFYAPVGSSLRALLTTRDATGALTVDPPVSLSLLGNDSGAKLDGYVLSPSTPGVSLLEAHTDLGSGEAVVEAYMPGSGEDLSAPTLYGRPGDLVQVPVFYHPSPFAANPTFDVIVSGDSGSASLPTLEGQPLFYGSLFGKTGIVYAQPTGKAGTVRIWAQGLSASDPATSFFLLPFRLPSSPSDDPATQDDGGDTGKGGNAPAIQDFTLRFRPVSGVTSEALHGGTGLIRMVSSTETPSLTSPTEGQIAGKTLPIEVESTKTSAGILYAKASVDHAPPVSIFFASDALTASLPTQDLTEGSHALQVTLVNALDEETHKAVSFQVDHTPPTALIASPAANASVSSPLAVQGTAQDASGPVSQLSGYRLVVSDSSGGKALLTKTGTKPVQNGLLGTLDISTLPTGTTLYLRLEVTDQAGNITTQEAPFSRAGTLKKGDVNGDNRVDLKDATYLLQIAVGSRTPTADQKTAGDMNNDGRINVGDVVLLLKLAIGG